MVQQLTRKSMPFGASTDGEGRLIQGHIPFTTSDLYKWKSHGKGMRKNPEGFLNLTRGLFISMTPPGWHPELPQVTLNREERPVFSKDLDEAKQENRNSAGHAVIRGRKQVVPDTKPNVDHWDHGEDGRRQRLTQYKNMIPKGVQAERKKYLYWKEIVNQEPTENPATFLQHSGDASESIPQLTLSHWKGMQSWGHISFPKVPPTLGVNFRNWK